jgi:hypothetical protein
MNDKSMDGLIEFLDWTAEKGMMAKNTVNGRKAAVSGVLGVLDPEEKGDITVIDLDSVMSRFINLQGKKYNTSSLNVYKSRTNAAINDFRQYLSDPLAFKPLANKSEKNPANKPPKSQKSGTGKPNAEATHNAGLASTAHQASANVFPIQIRENVVIRIHGLPFDLTKAEAERIANVVNAMAVVTYDL